MLPIRPSSTQSFAPFLNQHTGVISVLQLSKCTHWEKWWWCLFSSQLKQFPTQWNDEPLRTAGRIPQDPFCNISFLLLFNYVWINNKNQVHNAKWTRRKNISHVLLHFKLSGFKDQVFNICHWVLTPNAECAIYAVLSLHVSFWICVDVRKKPWVV